MAGHRSSSSTSSASRRLMQELLAGHDEAFVLTEPDNHAANALYASLGGTRVDSVMWDF